MDAQCALCGKKRAEDSVYCDIHAKAEKSLQAAYAEWLKAFDGELGFADFLRRILELPETGNAVKDIARSLLKSKVGDP